MGGVCEPSVSIHIVLLPLQCDWLPPQTPAVIVPNGYGLFSQCIRQQKKRKEKERNKERKKKETNKDLLPTLICLHQDI